MSAAPPVRVRKRPEPKAAAPSSKRALDLHVPEAKMRVKRVIYGQEHERVEEIDVPAFHGPVAYVRVSGAVTKNLGDYNSAKVEVSVSMPCYPTEPEVERTYRDLSLLVDRYVTHELDVATGNANPEDPIT